MSAGTAGIPTQLMLVALLCGGATLGTARAAAQPIFGPGEERPELPEPPPPSDVELPAVPALPAGDEPSLGSGLAVHVRAFRFEGHTVFEPSELAAVTAPFANRVIQSEELIEAAAAVTRLYHEHGYVTSGAVLPDQRIRDGTVLLRVIEGRLSGVEVTGTRWFRESYFRDRLERAGQAPVSADRIERRLRLLQRDPYVAQIRARLEPGRALGESELHVEVEERRPFDLEIEGSNEYTPSIGSLGLGVAPRLGNLIGHSDSLEGWIDLTEGLFAWHVRYELPLNSYDTRLGLYARGSDSEVVEDDFEALGIETEVRTYGIDLSQPLWRDAIDEVWFRVRAESRELETCIDAFRFIGGGCTAFPFLEGQTDPTQTVNVLRFAQDATRATTSDVFALRMIWSVGLDIWGATDRSPEGGASGEFFAWLGQAQWAHRFSERWLGTQLVTRVDAQLTDDPLLTLEKFAIGGRRTVRGYRENELVRDNGVVGSIELRVPVLRGALGQSYLELVPFVDGGWGWDARGDRSDRGLASVGAGLRLTPWPWLLAEIFWGHRLEKVRTTGSYDLQDDGLHFRVALLPFDALTEWLPSFSGERAP